MAHGVNSEVASERFQPSTSKSARVPDFTEDKVDLDADQLPNDEPGDNEYPEGLRLILLVSATMIAVFLIALDQVSDQVNHAQQLARPISLTLNVRQLSAQQSPRSPTNSTASETFLGTQLRIS
jgi:hypothetical protein